jgi:undecaprenyl-diphosphatase
MNQMNNRGSTFRKRVPEAFRSVGNVFQAGFEWIGKYELHVLIGLLVAAGAVWIFVVIADEVMEGDTQQFDEWAVRVLRKPDDLAKPIGPTWLVEVGRDLTALGGVAALTLITLAVVGFLWLRRMYGAMWLVLAATLGGLVAATLLKSLFDRPRPNLVPHLSLVYTTSFPSGHSMLSATVYLTLGALLGRFVLERSLKAYFLIVALVLTGLVGISRVYLGVHYPTDVLAGWTAGLAWAIVCWLVARSLQKRGKVEQAAARCKPSESKSTP